jgi:pimeloyl-ACP methyl ester carboxylesterase
VNLQSYTVETGDHLTLPLWRSPVGKPRHTVLLLHGGSASAETFVVPSAGNLTQFLNAMDLDVWALDWRGSNRVAGKPGATAVFSLDAAARYDVPGAIAVIRGALEKEGRSADGLRVLGHCLGGGLIAAAVNDGHVAPPTIGAVVMSALGLFYAAPWDGMVKVQDYVIEQVLEVNPPTVTVNVGPQSRFPKPMDASYAQWPDTLRHHCKCEVCYQLSFMYGHPFLEENLCDGIHEDGRLDELFNRMPIVLFQHCGQNLRRGLYAPLNQPEDLFVLPPAAKPRGDRFSMPVTLITGERNTLWHRESIDRMHEWLLSNGHKGAVKHVIPGYAHQDLLWGKRSAREVYPHLADGLLR